MSLDDWYSGSCETVCAEVFNFKLSKLVFAETYEGLRCYENDLVADRCKAQGSV